MRVSINPSVLLTILALVCSTLDARPPTNRFESFKMNPRVAFNSCQAVLGSFAYGCHAIIWKGQWSNRQFFNATSTSVGSFNFFNGVGDLNAQEGDSTFFPQGNPPGTWYRSDWSDAAELAIGASLYMYKWDSPTYIRIDISNTPGTAVIEEVTFNVPDSEPGIAFQCGFATATFPDDIDESCSLKEGFNFFLHEVELLFWGDFDSSNDGFKRLSGASFASGIREGFYVNDPPEGVDPKKIEDFINAVAKELAPRLLVETDQGEVLRIDDFEKRLADREKPQKHQ